MLTQHMMMFTSNSYFDPNMIKFCNGVVFHVTSEQYTGGLIEFTSLGGIDLKKHDIKLPVIEFGNVVDCKYHPVWGQTKALVHELYVNNGSKVSTMMILTRLSEDEPDKAMSISVHHDRTPRVTLSCMVNGTHDADGRYETDIFKVYPTSSGYKLYRETAFVNWEFPKRDRCKVDGYRFNIPETMEVPDDMLNRE